jgi:hypothetical protein
MIVHRILAFTLVGVFLSAGGCAAPDLRPSSTVVDELMLKSGLWVQLAQVEPNMQVGISQAHARSTQLTDADMEQLSNAIATAYAADSLRMTVRDQLGASLSSQDATTVLRWLSTELGQRITALEEAGSSPGEALERQNAGPRVFAGLSAPRKERVERLAKATLSAEAAATIIIDSMVGMTQGVALSVPGATRESIDDLKAKFEPQRTRYIEALGPQIVADYAAMYQALSDQELDQYLAFCESPAGQQYAVASLDAIDKALTQAAVRLGQQMVRAPLDLSVNPGAPPGALVSLKTARTALTTTVPVA